MNPSVSICFDEDNQVYIWKTTSIEKFCLSLTFAKYTKIVREFNRLSYLPNLTRLEDSNGEITYNNYIYTDTNYDVYVQLFGSYAKCFIYSIIIMIDNKVVCHFDVEKN